MVDWRDPTPLPPIFRHDPDRLPGFVPRCRACSAREETIDALLMLCGALAIGVVVCVLALVLS